MAKLSIRIDLDDGGRLGPGKIRLLELVAEKGSISAAGAALGMSYRRAWTLIAEMNTGLAQAVVRTQTGGRKGGGAVLTEFGESVVTAYRSVEASAAAAAAPFLVTVAPPRPSDER